MSNIFKRLSAFLICVALIVCMPAAALAAGWDGAAESETVEMPEGGVGSDVTYSGDYGVVEGDTNVDILVYLGLEIIGQTEDTVIYEGDDLQLGIAVRGCAPFDYQWEVSLDGGETWKSLAGGTDRYDITSAEINPNGSAIPYQYRVTVTDPLGASRSTVIEVLVSDEEYEYRRIEHNDTGIAATALMNKNTDLTVGNLNEDSLVYNELANSIAPGCIPLISADISLDNHKNSNPPYMGNVELEFPVGDEYEGQTLRVLQFVDGEVIEHTGVVENGILTISVDKLGQFMVEAPSDDACTITITSGAGGTTSPANTVSVKKGSDKTITVLPDSGYEIDQVLVDGQPVNLKGNTYTFENIRGNHTFEASFREVGDSDVRHKVYIGEGEHGNAEPSKYVYVKHGDSLTVTVTPDAGYEIDYVTVNGANYAFVGKYVTIPAVTEDLEIRIYYKKTAVSEPPVTKTITASAGEGGTITPAGEVSVNYGGDAYFYIVPDAGYVIDKVFVDGAEVTVTDNIYHFINVVESHSIRATFKPGESEEVTLVTIHALCGEHGTISPAGTYTIPKGGSQTFHFVPDEGYGVGAIYVDGKLVGISNLSYTLNNIRRTTTIRVLFTSNSLIATDDVTSDGTYILIWVLLCVAAGTAVTMFILILFRRKKEEEEAAVEAIPTETISEKRE